MLANDSAFAGDIWSSLQQPARPSKLGSPYLLLLAALDHGWQIEGPVYLMPRWSEGTPRFYHFILQRAIQPGSPRLISVPEGPDVDLFVKDAGLTVTVKR